MWYKWSIRQGTEISKGALLGVFACMHRRSHLRSKVILAGQDARVTLGDCCRLLDWVHCLRVRSSRQSGGSRPCLRTETSNHSALELLERGERHLIENSKPLLRSRLTPCNNFDLDEGSGHHLRLDGAQGLSWAVWGRQLMREIRLGMVGD